MDERTIEPAAKFIPRRGEMGQPALEDLRRWIHAEPVRRGFLAVKRAKRFSPCVARPMLLSRSGQTANLCHRPRATGVLGQGACHRSSTEIKPSITLEVLPTVSPLLAGRHGRPGQSPRRRRRRCGDGIQQCLGAKIPAFQTQGDKDSSVRPKKTPTQKPLGTKSQTERR